MKPEAHLPVAAYERQHPVLANPGETRLLDHLPQLDGLRAIAVGLVLWSHFTPASLKFRGNPPWGAIGVGVFFTLSGFLITRILLNCRLKIIDRRATFSSSIKQFYARRFLRIFPLYYGTLSALWLLDVTHFRERTWWNVLYLTNYRFGAYPEGGPGAERHLWSLSVEEQFYVFWPFMILLCPRRLLAPLIVLTVAIGPVWRAFTYSPNFLVHEWMTPGCLDLLGMGALLALLSLPRFGLSHWRDGFVQLCGLVGVPLLVAYLAQRWYPTTTAKGVPTAVSFDWIDYGGAAYPITALAAVWLVGTASRGFRGPIGWFLTWGPIVYVGRISYGLYVLHMLVPLTLAYFFPKWFGHTLPRTGWDTVIFVAVAVAAASVSWFAFEAPVNRLKRYFEYDKTAAAKASMSAAAA